MARDTTPLNTRRKDIAVGLSFGCDLCSELNRLQSEFVESGNTVHAMKAFLLAYNNGERPPDWVTDWLYHAFAEFDANEGLLDLQRLLGLAAQGKGKESPFTTIARGEAEQDLMLEIWTLKTAFNLSTGDAADLVSQRIMDNPAWHNSNHNLQPLSGATLEDKYNRKYSALYGSIIWPITPAEWAREDLLSGLNSYPKNNAMVAKLKRTLTTSKTR